jgi:ribosomal protein S27E
MAEKEPLRLIPGRWYVGVDCKNPKCGEFIAFAYDPTGGKAKAAGAGKLGVDCPACGKMGIYLPSDVKTQQAPPAH